MKTEQEEEEEQTYKTYHNRQANCLSMTRHKYPTKEFTYSSVSEESVFISVFCQRRMCVFFRARKEAVRKERTRK